MYLMMKMLFKLSSDYNLRRRISGLLNLFSLLSQANKLKSAKSLSFAIFPELCLSMASLIVNTKKFKSCSRLG